MISPQNIGLDLYLWIGHSHTRDEPRPRNFLGAGLDALELTWLQLPASWPLACERLAIGLSVRPASCHVSKTSQNRRYASQLLVWNNQYTPCEVCELTINKSIRQSRDDPVCDTPILVFILSLTTDVLPDDVDYRNPELCSDVGYGPTPVAMNPLDMFHPQSCFEIV